MIIFTKIAVKLKDNYLTVIFRELTLATVTLALFDTKDIDFQTKKRASL